MINNELSISSSVSTNSTNKPNLNKGSKTVETTTKETAAAVYESEKVVESTTYKTDFAKVTAMKEETDRRMVELFRQSIDSGFLKQAGGLRGVLDRILKGEKVEGIDIEVTEESIKQAQEDVAEGGYWSAESTSDRFIEFAIALSGDDKGKADLLIDAFKEGYAMAEEIWGGELPELSQKTYDMTLEKFENWRNE